MVGEYDRPHNSVNSGQKRSGSPDAEGLSPWSRVCAGSWTVEQHENGEARRSHGGSPWEKWPNLRIWLRNRQNWPVFPDQRLWTGKLLVLNPLLAGLLQGIPRRLRLIARCQIGHCPNSITLDVHSERQKTASRGPSLQP